MVVFLRSMLIFRKAAERTAIRKRMEDKWDKRQLDLIIGLENDLENFVLKILGLFLYETDAEKWFSVKMLFSLH